MKLSNLRKTIILLLTRDSQIFRAQATDINNCTPPLFFGHIDQITSCEQSLEILPHCRNLEAVVVNEDIFINDEYHFPHFLYDLKEVVNKMSKKPVVLFVGNIARHKWANDFLSDYGEDTQSAELSTVGPLVWATVLLAQEKKATLN